MPIAPVVRTQITRGGLPIAPVEIADEVEQYARAWGRHATLHFVPTLFFNGRILRGTWVVKMTLRPDDTRMKLWQEQRVSEAPTEDVWLHEPNPDVGKIIPHSGNLREPAYRPFNLTDLGASGVRAFLEAGNMWSGRNEIRSPEEELKYNQEQRRQMVEKARAHAREAGREIAADQYRSRFDKESQVGVIADVKDVKDVPSTRAAKKPRTKKE